MISLTSLSDSLHLFGKSIHAEMVTKVNYSLTHTPSDIGLQTWRLVITLSGSKIAEDDSCKIEFERTWDAEAPSDLLAFEQVYDKVRREMESFLAKRRMESGYAEQALMAATASLEDLQQLWRTTDQPAQPEHG